MVGLGKAKRSVEKDHLPRYHKMMPSTRVVTATSPSDSRMISSSSSSGATPIERPTKTAKIAAPLLLLTQDGVGIEVSSESEAALQHVTVISKSHSLSTKSSTSQERKAKVAALQANVEALRATAMLRQAEADLAKEMAELSGSELGAPSGSSDNFVGCEMCGQGPVAEAERMLCPECALIGCVRCVACGPQENLCCQQCFEDAKEAAEATDAAAEVPLSRDEANDAESHMPTPTLPRMLKASMPTPTWQEMLKASRPMPPKMLKASMLKPRVQLEPQPNGLPQLRRRCPNDLTYRTEKASSREGSSHRG